MSFNSMRLFYIQIASFRLLKKARQHMLKPLPHERGAEMLVKAVFSAPKRKGGRFPAALPLDA